MHKAEDRQQSSRHLWELASRVKERALRGDHLMAYPLMEDAHLEDQLGRKKERKKERKKNWG